MSFKDEVSFTIPLIGTEEEVEITCEFSVTSWGSAASYWDPGDGPEWEIDKILLDGEEVPIWDKTEIVVEIVTPGHHDGHLWIPGQPYGRFRERKKMAPLWESLAEACNNYIAENYEFEPPEPDYDDYY
jgi:hypothetical protein